MTMMMRNPDPEALYCPECGSPSEDIPLVDGYFNAFTYIYQCDSCGALVEDGKFLTLRDARDKFRN